MLSQDGLVRLAAAESLYPLWLQHDLVKRVPEPGYESQIWRYPVIRELLMAAGESITAEEAERRVLTLQCSTLDRPGVTHTLFCGIQMLLSGEIARSHRHTQAALRFVIEGEGAFTAANGERCAMEPGDFLLNPSWMFHDHGLEGEGRMIWLDGLDVPIVNYLGATFAELYPDEQFPSSVPANDSLARYGAGILPVEHGFAAPHSPQLRYPYSRVRPALADLLGAGKLDQHHGVFMRYSNPLSGGHVLPTMSGRIQLLPEGFETRRVRSTESTVLHIAEGRGHSRIGDHVFEWGEKDMISVPNWTWVSHQADRESVIFSFSDCPILETLGLFREERD